MSLKLVIENGEFKFSGSSFHITKERNELLKSYHKQVFNYGVKLCLMPNNEQI